MSKWHHIDTAPKDGTEIIIASWGGSSNGDLFPWWLEETNWQTSASGEGECWLLTAERMNAHTGSFPATHWMPMPTLEAESVDAARDGVEREARNEPNSLARDVERMREALSSLNNLKWALKNSGQWDGATEFDHDRLRTALLSLTQEGGR
jgi:hypothetical protein